MKEYYFLNDNNEQQGPVTLDELRAATTPETLVWCDGMDDWGEASTLPEYFETSPEATSVYTGETVAPYTGEEETQAYESYDETQYQEEYQEVYTTGQSPLNTLLRTLSLVVFSIVVFVYGVIIGLGMGGGQSLHNLFNNGFENPFMAITELFNNRSHSSYDFQENADNEYTENRDDSEATVVTISDYSEPSMPEEYNMGEALAEMAAGNNFMGTCEGMTVSNFDNVSYKCNITGKQMKYELNGYRLQFFFEQTAHNPSAPITGIAVSYDLAYTSTSVYTVINDFEAKMDTYGFEKFGNTYVTRSGAYVSGGYTGERFYIYYYYPNAPEKGPAPRR